jgi:hypothetical protein
MSWINSEDIAICLVYVYDRGAPVTAQVDNGFKEPVFEVLEALRPNFTRAHEWPKSGTRGTYSQLVDDYPSIAGKSHIMARVGVERSTGAVVDLSSYFGRKV